MMTFQRPTAVTELDQDAIWHRAAIKARDAAGLGEINELLRERDSLLIDVMRLEGQISRHLDALCDSLVSLEEISRITGIHVGVLAPHTAAYKSQLKTLAAPTK